MNTLQRMCVEYVKHFDNPELKDRAQNIQCLSYFAGASMALKIYDHPAKDVVLIFTQHIIAPRGYGEVKRIADEALREHAHSA